MNELLSIVIKSHGGNDRWNQLKKVQAHLHIDGKLWAVKGRPSVFRDVHFHTHLHDQNDGFTDFPEPGQFTTFTPDRLAIESVEGEVIQELLNPRASFDGHVWSTPWTLMQMLYFSHYALWTYLVLPFNFALPGYGVRETDPWEQDGEILRRLEVTYPPEVATHNRVQVFYFDQGGLLRRHDYAPDIMGGFPSTETVSDYQEFDGILVPTKRRIYSRNEDNTYNHEPVLVSVDVESLKFS